MTNEEMWEIINSTEDMDLRDMFSDMMKELCKFDDRDVNDNQ